MPIRKRKDKRRQGLSMMEQAELMIGPSPRGGIFSDDGARQRAWQQYRDELMAKSRAGRRPWAWWRFEQETEPPRRERALLEAHGLLRPDELGELTEQAVEEAKSAQAGPDD